MAIDLTFPEPDDVLLSTIPSDYYPHANPRYRAWMWRQYLTALQVAVELGTGDIGRISAEMARRESNGTT